MSELDDYDYELPPELIAQTPARRRADARLLVVGRDDGSFSHRHVRDLPALLSPGDCLVVNDSRVLPARLLGNRTHTGGVWEGLFLAMETGGAWRLLCKCRGRLAAGQSVTLRDREARDELRLELIEKQPGGVWLARPESDRETLDLLEQFGRVPLPHYIRGGEMIESDRARYQTVYANQPGSVAAPTAGLHFSEGLLQQLQERGVTVARVTLHIGLGTFRPISVSSLDDHEMHAEWGEAPAAAVEQIQQTRKSGGRVVAVGTTVVRVLESASSEGTLKPWRGETRLFIRPGYEFRAVDALMTNFHLPRSTLLVLVRTFGGDATMRAAYQEAIDERYRFYSYGDAMLIT